MSTIRANTLQDRVTNKSLGAERLIEGAVKSWGCHNGATGAAAASFNISSTVDIQAGRYQANFSALFVHVNIVPHVTDWYVGVSGAYEWATWGFKFFNNAQTGAATDASSIVTSVSGPLA